ncbi:carbohydrate-binding protein [Winogradskyella vincentii]|uniref:Carbohydrate-binding protein n=1 Tax=Winogradskyella vincentii TaxID=2877122 RepID=A0ABS7Y2J3_9FLAO|nr:carbohydrate-binding protein [Winogradskyella vincentii]MCA0154132.1 carbohydrate-binding protein [Winogradskyella vincentii]
MKNIKLKHWRTALAIFGLMVITISCERGFSDDVELATFNPNGEIFTDIPIGLNDSVFISFDPATGANVEGFDVDNDVAFEGSSSIRIDVPTPNDPEGGYIGGIFKDRGAGRDLTGYDALTFWAKGSTTATVGTFGFGTDFAENKYAVEINDVELSTTWKKIIIPIPDPSKLVQEKGMFLFAAGTQSTNGVGFTFWMDEMRFEKLGTLGQPRPAILGGQDQTAQINIGTSLPLSNLTQTYNLPNGLDVTTSCTPAYFDFETSNPFVASVDEGGVVTVDGPGEIDPETGLVDNTSVITGYMGGVLASGSLTVQSVDIDVISIFSDLYANVPVDNYNGFYFDGFQTTLGGAIEENGNNIIDYTEMNFVAIEFYGREGSGVPPVDASDMTQLHIDIRVNETVDPSDFFRIELFNNFTTGNQVAGSFTISGSELLSNEWVEFDIPLSSFAGLSAQDALGAFIFVTDGTIANVSLDNIYFFNEN